MTDLRTHLLACLDGLIDQCRAATPGPWSHEGWVHGDTATETYGVWAGPPEQSPPIARTDRLKQGWDDAAHIAACSPDRMARLYEGLRAEVEPHIADLYQPGGIFDTGKRYCRVDRQCGPCPFVRRLAAMLGLDTEGAS